jgi:protein-tyrosine phosphatase
MSHMSTVEPTQEQLAELVGKSILTAYGDPRFSQIYGNLWMGGVPVIKAPSYFKTIINLAPDSRYMWEPYQIMVRVKMEDDQWLPPDRILRCVSEIAYKHSQVEPTLVHCVAGQNRSGLICALALRHLDLSADEVIETVRRARFKHCLNNKAFVKKIHEGLV